MGYTPRHATSSDAESESFRDIITGYSERRTAILVGGFGPLEGMGQSPVRRNKFKGFVGRLSAVALVVGATSVAVGEVSHRNGVDAPTDAFRVAVAGLGRVPGVGPAFHFDGEPIPFTRVGNDEVHPQGAEAGSPDIILGGLATRFIDNSGKE